MGGRFKLNSIEDGFSPTVGTTREWGGHTIHIHGGMGE